MGLFPVIFILSAIKLFLGSSIVYFLYNQVVSIFALFFNDFTYKKI